MTFQETMHKFRNGQIQKKNDKENMINFVRLKF